MDLGKVIAGKIRQIDSRLYTEVLHRKPNDYLSDIVHIFINIKPPCNNHFGFIAIRRDGSMLVNNYLEQRMVETSIADPKCYDVITTELKRMINRWCRTAQLLGE